MLPVCTTAAHSLLGMANLPALLLDRGWSAVPGFIITTRTRAGVGSDLSPTSNELI